MRADKEPQPRVGRRVAKGADAMRHFPITDALRFGQRPLARSTAEDARGPEPGPHPLQEGELEARLGTAWSLVVLGEGVPVVAQITALRGAATELAARDVAVFLDGPGATSLHDQIGEGFAVLLIAPDGEARLHSEVPVDPDEILDLIDNPPLPDDETVEE